MREVRAGPARAGGIGPVGLLVYFPRAGATWTPKHTQAAKHDGRRHSDRLRSKSLSSRPGPGSCIQYDSTVTAVGGGR